MARYVLAIVGPVLGGRDKSLRSLSDALSGQVIGTCYVTASWVASAGRYKRRVAPTHMYQIAATIGGKRYAGACQGEGSIVNLRCVTK